MKNCKACNEIIPSSIYIEGRRIILTTRKYCLICSPYGARKMNRAKNKDEKFCAGCNDILPINSFYKRRCRAGHSTWCKRCIQKEGTKRQQLFKQKCVEYKGNKCMICGYSKYIGALEFHHRDATKKDFQVSKIKNHKWNEYIINELDKCDLLCSNCHKEIHATLRDTTPV
jgi:hypothetical protein